MTKGSSHIHLRGVYKPTSPSKYQSYTVLRYKLPLNNELKKKFGLNSDYFKYYYDTANRSALGFSAISHSLFSQEGSYSFVLVG